MFFKNLRSDFGGLNENEVFKYFFGTLMLGFYLLSRG